MHKGRPEHNVAEITHVIGDVEGQDLHRLRRHDRHRRLDHRGRQGADHAGAETVYVTATHGIFSPPAFERIEAAPVEECRHQHRAASRQSASTARSGCSRSRRCSRTRSRTCSSDEVVSELFDPDFQL